MPNYNMKAGPGRPKGLSNKATTNARLAISEFVDGNAHRLVEWLDRIAEKDPDSAFKAFMSVVEYHIPKLNRIEHAGDKNNPIRHKFEWDMSKKE